MKINYLKIDRAIGSSLMALAAAGAIVALPETANAVDLNFNTPVETNNVSNVSGLNLGNGYNGTTMRFTNVASGIDAKVTRSVFGAGYSFVAHMPDYYATNGATQPSGDIAPVYRMAPNTSGQAV